MSGYSATCIRDELEDMGFPAKVYRNPHASITNALNRMVDAGKLVLATDQDTNRTVYMWAGGIGAHCLRRQDQEVDRLDCQYTFCCELTEDDSVDHLHFRRAQ
jgi:hypothetical protein